MDINNKQRQILELIFTNPVPSNILWKDIESLFIALGADITQGRGSRVRVNRRRLDRRQTSPVGDAMRTPVGMSSHLGNRGSCNKSNPRSKISSIGNISPSVVINLWSFVARIIEPSSKQYSNTSC
ncbi:HicA protein [Calothrix brevissima NIES-22]|nr:HicA protein [Calothrix brevissima NIES-22]